MAETNPYAIDSDDVPIAVIELSQRQLTDLETVHENLHRENAERTPLSTTIDLMTQHSLSDDVIN